MRDHYSNQIYIYF